MSDLQKGYGWKLGPIQFPSGLHISVTHLHSRPGVAEKLIDVSEVRNRTDWHFCRILQNVPMIWRPKESVQLTKGQQFMDCHKPFQTDPSLARSLQLSLKLFLTLTRDMKLKRIGWDAAWTTDFYHLVYEPASITQNRLNQRWNLVDYEFTPWWHD